MADKPFVVNDRRKFTSDGELRPDAPPSEPKPARVPDPPPAPPPTAAKGPQPVPHSAARTADAANSTDPTTAEPSQDDFPPPPTTEQTDQASRAYKATVDRLDVAIRSGNPGMERIPDMTFERVVQTIYMQAIVQLGGAVEQGQQPHVDILGARQSIDMLAVIAEKTKGNLSPEEDNLLQAALFEMRMAFLEVTQAFARQAAARQPGPAGPGSGGQAGPNGGPSIVR